MADATTEQDLTRHLHIVQNMIDVSAERLEGLRTQCATSAELTQQEIRTLEVGVHPPSKNHEISTHNLQPFSKFVRPISGKAYQNVFRPDCNEAEN